MKRKLTIVDLMRGRFGRFFPLDTWRPWIAVAAAIFGLAKDLIEADQQSLLALMGRKVVPSSPAREVFIVAGRRAGKSRFSAWVAVYLACFKDYSRVLAIGERGVVMVLAPDRRQAKTTFRYIEGLLDGDPMLHALIVGRTQESISLSNGITIEVQTASFRSVRGYTVVAAIVEEAAFLPNDDSASPDTALLAALRPTMATVPGALLLVIGSPYARRGELYRAWKDHYGVDEDPVQVFQAPTLALNPTVASATVGQAYADDPEAASAEYGAEFRRDLEPFINREVLERLVVPGVVEIPRERGIRYIAFTDPSGGGQDSFTLAIAHLGKDRRIVLDAVREVAPPFSPEQTVSDFAVLLRSYGISSVTGDRYAGEWPREAFRKHGVNYVVSEWSKSEIYRDVLPLVNSSRVALLDNPRLVAQLLNLERRTSRGGRDSIDHAPGAHDDLANAVCGAVVAAGTHDPRGGVIVDVFSGEIVSGRDSQGRVWRNRRIVFDPSPVLPRESPIRPALPLPTVRIRDEHSEAGFLIINESDFDAERHVLWREVSKTGVQTP